MDDVGPEVRDLAAAQTALADLLSSLRPDAWGRATPCEDWDVAAVVRHLVVGERAFAVSLSGDAYDLAAIGTEVAASPDDALAPAYDDARRGLGSALSSAGEGDFPTGLGPMTAAEIARLRTIEALVHGWDVARATGGSLPVDDGVALRAIDHGHALIQRLPPGRTPFGPEQTTAAVAPALDRLAGLLGRRVG